MPLRRPIRAADRTTGLQSSLSSPLARPLVRACQLLLLSSAAATVIHLPEARAQGAPGAQAVRSYDIPAGPLSNVLTRFSREAGVALVGAAGGVEGRASPGLHGSHDVQSGFAAVLAGSGLEAFRQADGSYGLRAAPPPPAPVQVAQTASGPSTLPSVRVTAQSEREATTEGTGSYTTRATTLGKTEHSLREIPQSVSVITRQQMEDRNVVTIEEAMNYATGIGAYNNTGQGTSSFYARGYDGLQMQFDGVASGAGNSHADMSVYDRIEIQRGPSGLLQGSGNPAGTVNLVRKRGQREFATSGSLSLGSWNNHGGSTDIGGPLNEAGTVRARAVLAARQRDFFYRNADERSTNAYLALDADLGARTKVGVALLTQSDRNTPTAGVVAYTGGRMPAWDRATNLNAPWSHSELDLHELSADLSHAFNDDWRVRAGVRYRKSLFNYKTGRLQSAIDPATDRATVQRYEHQSQNGSYLAGDLNLVGHFDALGRRHEILLGVNAERNEYDYHWAVQPYPGSYDVNNLQYDVGLVPQASPKTGYSTVQSGIYAMTRLKVLDPVTLLLGGRFSNYDSRSRSIVPDTARDWIPGSKETGEFTPYGGLIWDFSRQFSWYASYADVFMPQSTRDWEGRSLKPRVGWQVETGIKGEFFNGRLNGTLALFRLRDENRAVLDPDPTHSCNGGTCSMAGGLMQTQGWEVDVSGSPWPGLEIAAGYTRSDTTTLKDTNPANQGVSRSSMTYLPRHAFKFWGNYKFAQRMLAGWQLGGGVQAYSSTQGSGGLSQGGYTTASVQVGYQVNRHWKATFTVNNLFDRVYFRQLNGPAGYNYFGEPRNAMLTLRAHY